MAGTKFFFSAAERSAAERRQAQELGGTGEAIAARHLTDLGYTVIDKNWRNGRHEIDLVAIEGGELVIVEVKTRSGNLLRPEEAVDRRKRRALVEAANQYVAASRRTEPVRFDIVAVDKSGGDTRVEVIRNAFDIFGC